MTKAFGVLILAFVCLILLLAANVAPANPPVVLVPQQQYPQVYPAYGAAYSGLSAAELREILDEFRGKLLQDLRGAQQSQVLVKPPKGKEEPLPEPKKKVSNGGKNRGEWILKDSQWAPITFGFKSCVGCHDASVAAKKSKGIAFFAQGKRKVFSDREAYFISREVFTYGTMPMGVGITKAELENIADQVDKDVVGE